MGFANPATVHRRDFVLGGVSIDTEDTMCRRSGGDSVVSTRQPEFLIFALDCDRSALFLHPRLVQEVIEVLCVITWIVLLVARCGHLLAVFGEIDGVPVSSNVAFAYGLLGYFSALDTRPPHLFVI